MERFLTTLLRLFLLGMFGILASEGIKSIFRACQQFYLSLQTHHWTRTQAQILRYEVSDYRTGGRTDRTRYRYALLCSYAVQGRSYIHRMVWHHGFETLDSAKQAGALAGCTQSWVNLFYNPQQPAQSTCTPGQDWRSLSGILYGIPLVTLGIGLFLATFLSFFSIAGEVIVIVCAPFLIATWIAAAVWIIILIPCGLLSLLFGIFEPKDEIIPR
ncbi:DUF3592 domain-containing protein [Alkalinema pantanalense CENA528]|uniref:DUF3592 domain-containing protein n=1 Tax=Alkalinema pantanalense TaxID=1620705 RepID=UPI003D6FFE00